MRGRARNARPGALCTLLVFKRLAVAIGTELARLPAMGGTLAVLVDVVHAAAMVLWLVGLPLLAWHRWPNVTRIYAWYAVVFVVVYQVSRLMLGECVLTTIARALWNSQAPGAAPMDVDEWFTVRLSRAVFSATPSHRTIIWLSQALAVVTALGSLVALRRAPQRRTATS